MSTPPTSIIAALLNHSSSDPDRPCLIWAGRTWSYHDIASMAQVWAGYYQQRGLQRGDRVGLFLPSGLAFLGAYLGAHLAGVAVVLINTSYRHGELSHIVTDSEPRLLITDRDGSEHVHHVASEAGCELLVLEAGVFLPTDPPAPQLSVELPQPNELAILAYTSGTTGRAKGAMLTHGCLAANSCAIGSAWHWSSADRLLLVLPLFHIHGLGVGVHGTIWAGASMDLRPRFEPAEVIATLASGAVTMFFGVPTIYSRLIAEVERQTPPRTLPLRLCVSGSAPLSPQTLTEFEQRFGQRILERYGMTETGMNLTNPYLGERRAGTVGMPFPGQEARVVALHTRVALPDGVVGEIEVRGPHICAGYWRNPTATAELFHEDGWFSTGDLGWRSEDGYYTLTGRARELIIRGGYNIYPREVEEILLTYPGVAECAVFGMPDPDMGEQVVAAIVPNDPDQAPTREELERYCREHLAAYKCPRTIHFLRSLPRNAMGKVEKHKLRKEQW